MILFLSTGHPELDEILKKNNILDQEEQEKIRQKHFLMDLMRKKENKDKKEHCAVQEYIKSYTERGLPAPTYYFISCRCKRCNPCRW